MQALEQIRRLLSRASILEVAGVREQFVDYMDVFYKRLLGAGGRYVFECRSGSCSSRIELPAREYQAAVTAPGLLLSEPGSQKGDEGYTLLPPPRGNEILWCNGYPGGAEAGGLVLGYCAGSPLVLDEEALLRHVLVVGATGSGKSHTAARIAACSSRIGFKPVILDWHGEYEQLLREQGVDEYNVFSHPRLPPVAFTSPSIPLESSISVLESVLELSPFQSSILAAFLALAASQSVNTAKGLLDALTSQLEPGVIEEIQGILESGNTVHELLRAISSVVARKRDEMTKAEREIWLALLRRLNLITTSGYADLFTIRGTRRFEAIANLKDPMPTVIRLDSIRSTRIRKMYAIYLLQMLYTLATSGQPARILIVVEEAHNLLNNNVVPELLAETRKYGIGFVMVVHTPRLLPELSEANFNTIVAHRIVSVNDRLLVARAIGLEDDSLLSSLEEGTAIVRKHGAPTPVPVEVDVQAPCTH
ncbi:hypothetical protein CF15_00625 [Pyrodictium occultum]|uniref:AAA+ ATPase domain-containing protein n=1 Tax=Pyrodictium occultum TaxID=2309 RepID=A0A0V8RTU4_PYROC|nr:ATP-binding protein [Pyrodictium occultum]KSW11400.1 hypothetical protein CF15_00625 [Pyrodictium occultum]